MSRERSNTDDIMEAMEHFKAPCREDEAESVLDEPAEDAHVPSSDTANAAANAAAAAGERELSRDRSTSFDEIVLDWNSLFGQADCDIEVTQLGLKGLLRGCPFRSICWKLFLGILTEDRSLWCSEMKRHREQYQNIHTRFLADPRLQSPRADVTVDNPLSLDTDSSWNKYFQDEELRKLIVRDVERTFPEVDYFQEETIQSMLTDILFCYCRMHTTLGYRQGMHELVSVLVLVVDCDKRDSSNISPDDPGAEEMKVLLDSECVEADAYILFSALMETMNVWFDHSKPNAEGMSDVRPKNPLVKKLERIQDHLLKREDPLLHAHLQKLAIAPQLYALRWVRLLFCREFPLLDVLVLWDAILAYSPNLDLVDYVALAMLLGARESLLMGNETSAMGLLLNYPSVPDIQLVIQKALFLRNPKVYPRPPNWQLEDVEAAQRPTALHGAALKQKAGQWTQGALSLAGKVSSSAISKLKNIPANTRARTGTGDRGEPSPKSPPRKAGPNISQRLRLAGKANTPVHPGKSAVGATVSSAAKPREIMQTVAQTSAMSEETSLSPVPQEHLLEHATQNSSVELTKLHAACIRCSRHMNLYLRVLQSDVLTLNLPEECEDRVLRSVAGLKQVRDVLCGVLSSDEVQFQSLDGVTLPEGVSMAPQGLFGDYVDEAANLSPTFSDPGVDRTLGGVSEVHDDNDQEVPGSGSPPLPHRLGMELEETLS